MISTILIFLGFVLIHSATVAPSFKHQCVRMFGDRFMRVWYRFLYTGISIVTAGFAFYLISRVPDRVLWTGNEWIVWYFTAVRIGALVFAAGAFQHMDGLEFLGIRQVMRHLAGKKAGGNTEGLTQTELVTTGVYGVVRHPLYLAGIIFFTFDPQISVNGLTLTVLADAYFIWGAVVEDRRLLRIFGERYREYRKKVPMLIPGNRWYDSE